MGVTKIAAAFFSCVLAVFLTCPVLAENSPDDESALHSNRARKTPGESQEAPVGSGIPSVSTSQIHQSLNDNQGIVSVNQSSGGLNNQSNLRTIGLGADVGFLEGHSSVNAKLDGNSLSIPETTRTDIISESVKGNAGIIGINQAAGYGNNQSNVFAMSLGGAVALSETELTAVSTNNDYKAELPGNRLDSISDSFSNTHGVVQVTQSAGDGNILGNRMAISFSTEVLK
jgi:hypothetical protein